VILSELRWRSPERLRWLASKALHLLADRVRVASAADFPHTFAEFTYVLGHNPRARALRFSLDDGPWLDELRPGDTPALEAAVARHEGALALAQLRVWLARQPEAFTVARDAGGAVVAFVANVRLDRTTAHERAQDTVVHAAWEHASSLIGEPLARPVVYGRFLMDLERHQAPCLGMAVCTQAIGPLVFLPEFAGYYARFDRWEAWEEAARLCHAEVVPALAHAIGDKRFTVTIQDHRNLSGLDWMLRFCAGTSVQEWGAAAPAARQVAPVSALNYEEFTARTRDALRTLDDPLVLAKNPLIHCRAVAASARDSAEPTTRAEALARMLSQAIVDLQGSPRGERWQRVLFAAYVEPKGKHEGLAPQLGMSYSTFRRLLAAGTEHIVASLWAREVEAEQRVSSE
jgi:hypothetical protein